MPLKRLKSFVLRLLALLWLSALPLWAQGVFVPVKQVNGTVNGNQRGLLATLTVCAANASGIPCSPALGGALFKDAALTQPLANPTQTDANGNYPVMALAAGTYTITETASGFSGYSYQVTLPCPSAQPCTISTLTVTGSANITNLTTSSPTINGTPTGNGVPLITLRKGSGAGNYSSASTTFVQVDASNLLYAVTLPVGWKLLITCAGSATTLTAPTTFGVAITDAGTVLQEVDATAPVTGASEAFTLAWVFVGDGNAHSFDLRFRTINAADSVQMFNSSSTVLPTMTFLLTPSN